MGRSVEIMKKDCITAIKNAMNADNELLFDSPIRLARRKSNATSHVIDGKLMSADSVYETYILLEYEDRPLEILWETSLSKKSDIFGLGTSVASNGEYEVTLDGTYHLLLYLDQLHGREILAIRRISKGSELLYAETTELTIEDT